MHIQLKRYCTEDQVVAVRRLLADPAMDAVRLAIKAELKSMKPADYDNPSWAFKQAHDNGNNDAIEAVLLLLKE